MTIDELRAEALLLQPRERALLASDLLGSLDDMSESEIDSLWMAEALRRDGQIDSGAAVTRPADEVLAAIRARRT